MLCVRVEEVMLGPMVSLWGLLVELDALAQMRR